MYHKVYFRLTEFQLKELTHAHENELGTILRLSKALIHPTGVPIMLTKREMDELQDGDYHNITISSSRVKKMVFFLQILPVLGGNAALTGIVTSITNAVKNSRASSAQIAAAMATEELAEERKDLNNLLLINFKICLKYGFNK